MKPLIHLLCCLFAAGQVFSAGLPKAPSVEETLAHAGERTVLQQQVCLRTMADSCALLRRYKDMYEYTRAAYEAAPHSRLAPRLLNALQYYEKQLLPFTEQEVKNSQK